VGWWNLYRFDNGRVEALTKMDAEFGRPYWVFGNSTYAFVSENRIICTYAADGTWHLADLDTKTKRLEVIETPYSEITYLKANTDYVVFIGGSVHEPTSVVLLELEMKKTRTLKKSVNIPIESTYVSIPEILEFTTSKGQTAHAFFYTPKNKDYDQPRNEKPPLIVVSHGGPTSAATTSLNLAIQYWTSRGVAVLDVNYRGSTGYGRNYRDRLLGQWGIIDVEDCVNGAIHLVALGKVDEKDLLLEEEAPEALRHSVLSHSATSLVPEQAITV